MSARFGHGDPLALLRQLALDLQDERKAVAKAKATAVRGVYVPPATGAALEFERLSPELRPIAKAAFESLSGVPRDVALAALAIVFLRTLPEARRLELVAIVLEEVIDT